ncbi:MAG: hypothetical protein OXC93_12690 [Rhodospirillaceae bacterium]|nr:hypothetical protein [Rhodospirillaceae bacterium]
MKYYGIAVYDKYADGCRNGWFVGDARRAKLGQEELEEIILFLSRNPESGDAIKGTGKRGGWLSNLAGKDVPLFLLNVFSRGERANLSRAERNELRNILKAVAETCGEGVRENV